MRLESRIWRGISSGIILCLFSVLNAAILRGQIAPPVPPPGTPLGLQQEATGAIGHAYDDLSRVTLLVSSPSPEIRALLARGRDVYQHSLSLFRSNDFAGARETAMASSDLARAVEQLTAAKISSSTSQSLLPAPPLQPGPRSGPPGPPQPGVGTDQDLERVREHAHRLEQYLTEPASASAVREAKELINESDLLQEQARTLLKSQKLDQADATTRAADALLAAADHFVRWAWIANGLVPPQPGPPRPKGKLPPHPVPPPP